MFRNLAIALTMALATSTATAQTKALSAAVVAHPEPTVVSRLVRASTASSL